MKVVGIIPSRMKSSRLPGKALIDIDGLPMVVHVFKRAQLCSDLAEVYVATDSSEIFDIVKKNGGKPIMTSDKHKTGTDRIAEAARTIDCDIVVNIQGDEPLLVPENISELLAPFKADKELGIAALMCQTDQFDQASECKIVVGLDNNILYMSREDIPSRLRVAHNKLLKLYNIIAFKKDYLLKFADWDITPLEKIEYIEYLRPIEHGICIKGVLVSADIQSVDTVEDLAIARRKMQIDLIKTKYMLPRRVK